MGPTGNKPHATASLIHVFIRLQAACRFHRSEQENHQLDERVSIHLWRGGKCGVASGMDRMSRVGGGGGGSRGGNDKTGPYGGKRGVGVMEGAFQRYTGWDRTKTHFSFMSTMKRVGSLRNGSVEHVR